MLFLMTSTSLLSTCYFRVRAITQLMAVLLLYIESCMYGSLVTIHRKLYVNGIMVHSRATQKSKRKSYTVEFHDGDTFSFGYVELSIINRAKQYAVLQKFAL